MWRGSLHVAVAYVQQTGNIWLDKPLHGQNLLELESTIEFHTLQARLNVMEVWFHCAVHCAQWSAHGHA